MSRTTLHCHTCGTRAEVELGEREAETLRQQGYINRACRECVGITRWEMHGTPETAATPSTQPFAGCRGRVLVIDDDLDVLTVLSKGLAKNKFDVVVADSAREALTMLARGDFDVVLSDIRMPEFGGPQLMEFLDEHLPDYKERVVFMSGDTGSPETMAFIAQARRPFLPKPLEIPVLLEAIRPLLPEAAGFAPLQDAVLVAAVEPPAEPTPKPAGDITPEEKSATEEALSYAVIALRGEIKTVRRTLDERNAEVEALRRELATREADGRRRFDEIYREQERLQAEAAQKGQEAAAARTEFARREAELRKELKEGTQGGESLEQEAAALRQQAAAAEAQAHAELTRAQEEVKRTREELQQAGAELQRAQEEMKQQAAAFDPEQKRRLAQWDATREQLEQAQSKALKVETMLREFYLRIVNPLTVAVATTDMVSSSQWLSPRDRETLLLLEQNLDHLLDAVKVLKKQMQEQGIEFG